MSSSVAPLASEALLRATGDDVALHATLVSLQQALAASTSDELVGSHVAVLRPLCNVLSAFAAARTGPAEGTTTPHAVADSPPRLRTAECAVVCVRLLLERCPLHEQPQFLEVLQLILLVLSVPRALSSDEVRSDATLALGALSAGDGVSLLRLELHAPLLGHAFALLLQVADSEAAAGDKGNRSLRADAFRIMNLLMQRVGDGDALAYFLPGISSGLCVAIRKSTIDAPGGTGPSSAAASGDAAIHALRALTSMLRLTLGDVVCEQALAASLDAPPSIEEASCVLERLCQAAAGPETSPAHAALMRAGLLQDDELAERLRVHRSAAWVCKVAAKLEGLLPPMFTVLCRHTRSSVRAAAVDAAVELLSRCSWALPACTSAFLECVLGMADDPWPVVAAAATAGLRDMRVIAHHDSRSRSPTGLAVPWKQLSDLLGRQLDGFDAACRRSERDAIGASRVLTGAIGVAGPTLFAEAFLLPLRQRSRLCNLLVRLFVLDSDTRLQTGSLLIGEPTQPIASSEEGTRAGSDMTLPRRHRRLELLTSEESYAAAAGVARLVGRAASLESPTALMALTEELLTCLRVAVGSQTSGWRVRVASVVLVLAEVLFGASDSWDGIASSLQQLADGEWCVRANAMAGGSCSLASAAALAMEEVTQVDVESALHREAPHSPQYRDAACLTSVCVVFLGVCARALGKEFITMPCMLPAVFASLLEKLGDPVAEVSTAAAVALISTATHCGYSGRLCDLVAAHSDYIIDALCRQLRHLDAHPRAPRMFSALLRRCDVARMLLPILEEPLRSASAAIAGHVRTFLEVLCEVSHAALVEAEFLAIAPCTDNTRRHLATVLRAAATAADAAAPLVLEHDANCTVLVLDTVTDAVRTIAISNRALGDSAGAADALRPAVLPLLPYVHAMWPIYVSAVSSGHVVASRRALEQLPQVAEACGGDFLRQRFATELWPHLRRLVLDGVAQPRMLADAAPGTALRTQLAALACVHDLACHDASRDTVADVVSDALDALSTVVRSTRSEHAVVLAERVLNVLGTLDADAVWLALIKLRRERLPPLPTGLPTVLPCF